MHIKIAERLRPFSHTPGTYCILPGSSLRLQIFPALIRVHDLSKAEPEEIVSFKVPVKGPIKEFTLQLDLEKGLIHIWGKSNEAFFSYSISSAQQSHQIVVQINKGLSSWFPETITQNKSFKILKHSKTFAPPLIDRLSLGNHKSQDWDQVKRRGDLREILPVWLRLGQLIDSPKEIAYEGTAAFLKTCQDYSDFLNFFNIGFEGILSPRLTDDQHQGFELTSPPSTLSPLILLKEGAHVIRSLFFRIQQNDLFLLPQLPPQFHCGRFLQVCCGDWGLLDFEWSKKMMRRMVLHAEASGSINMHFPKDVRCYRLNGQIHSVEKPITVEKGELYTIDRFQK